MSYIREKVKKLNPVVSQVKKLNLVVNPGKKEHFSK